MVADDRTPEERDEQLEHAVLAEIICLHPAHLTSAELVLKMDGARDGESVAIGESLQALKRSGLVRLTGDVVEPTFAALRAAELFRWS